MAQIITTQASVRYRYGATEAAALSNIASAVLAQPLNVSKTSLETTYREGDELTYILTVTTGGTGFSPRDITPEATMAVIERPTPGIPEAMRAESMRITPKGCLSRSAAGIRGRTLIINLPGSKKASQENILAVIDPVAHGLDMLYSEGSADCAK